MTILDLPYTLFLEVLSHLAPADIVRCRRICRRFHEALTRQDLSISLILSYFPRSREGRLLRSFIANEENNNHVISHDWSVVFARLARRYVHLSRVSASQCIKIKTLKVTDMKNGYRLRGVLPWDKSLRMENKKAPLHYKEPHWTFDAGLGLLVYPALDGEAFEARDVGTGEEVRIEGFPLAGKIVRRVRLGSGVLIFEWCHDSVYHVPHESENAQPHFATAFDVRRGGGGIYDGMLPPPRGSQEGALAQWQITFRSEWKIHDLKVPLTTSMSDRFFSAHNATHYAVYTWRPMRPGAGR